MSGTLRWPASALGASRRWLGAMRPGRSAPLAGLLALVAAGCGASGRPGSAVAPAAARPLALPSPGDVGVILLTGLELPEAGTVIGGRFGGVGFDVRQATFQLSDAARARWTDDARRRGEGLLRERGFRVRGVGPVTGDAVQLVGVQYGVSGRVSELHVRETGPADAPLVDAQADVAWELLDLGSGSAVFGRSHHGAARAAGVDAAVGGALDQSFTRLLADSAFLRALAAPRSDPDAGSSGRFRREVPAGAEPIVLVPSDLNARRDTTLAGHVVAGVVQLLADERVLGTGFLLTRDGLGIAFGRSARRARGLRVRFASGVERPARVVRSSGSLDLSLIQVACSGECLTVDWDAPEEVPVFTNVVVVGASDGVSAEPPTVFGRVGGQWGLAHGVTLQGADGLVGGGEPVARTTSGRVFGLVVVGGARASVVLLSEALAALHVKPPEAVGER